VNERLVRLKEGSVYAQGYADDIFLLVVGRFQNTVSGLIQWALHTVELWCGGVGLSVNPDKTGIVAFTRKRKLTGFFEPSQSAEFHVGQVPRSDPGLTSDLEGTRMLK